MVKNELSIGAQQSYDVALKIAEHKINVIKEGTAKSISSYKAKVAFKNEKQEQILFATRKEHLLENITALYTTNEYEAKETLLKNNTLMHRLNWSFVKIDRSNPDKELIKKQIALNRHSTVIYDMNYERAQFDSKWYKIEKEKEIQFKLETDRLTQEVYKDHLKRERVSYTEFYQSVVNEHQGLIASCKETLNAFYPIVEEVIDYSYLQTTALEVRKQILATIKTIVALYKQLEQIDIETVYKDIDLQILDIQIKEKLDVFKERNAIIEEINDLKAKNEAISVEIQKQTEILDCLFEERITKKLADFTLNISVEDEKQVKVLNDIKEAFKAPSNEVFGTIYRILKNYILELCPYFYDYLEAKEAEYEKDNEAYRKEMVSSLSGHLANAYISSASDYLTLISTEHSEKSNLEVLKADYLNKVETIENLYIKEKEELRVAKQKRIEEYKQQKASAAINLKNADGSKASEIKDIVRLYKKEINAGELKRKFNLLKLKIKRLMQAKANYKLEVVNATNPAPVAYEHSYKKEVAADKKAKIYELKTLNRTLNKDYNSSKYRKNLNTTKRENGLGYLFLSVWAIGFVVFAVIPMIYTVLMFFSKVTYDNQGYSKLIDFSLTSGLTFPNWVGFDNFETLILQDINFAFTMIPRFFRSLLFYVPIVVFISFVLAMLLNSKIKGRTFFRVVYFLPVVIVSGPVLEMLNKQNSSGQSSIRLSLDGSSIAKILMSISPKALEYANEIFQNFIIILWMTGVPIVLFISALQKINRQLYEAAEIDGANKWQMLWTITYPLIKSVLLIVCLFTIMQVTTINVDFVNPINTWIDAKLAQTNFNIGLVSVGCWIQTFVVLLFVLVSFLLFREKEFVSKDKNYEEIEEAKRKKNQKKAKLVSMFKINEIKHFISNLFAPVSRAIATAKAKSKEKGE